MITPKDMDKILDTEPIVAMARPASLCIANNFGLDKYEGFVEGAYVENVPVPRNRLSHDEVSNAFYAKFDTGKNAIQAYKMFCDKLINSKTNKKVIFRHALPENINYQFDTNYVFKVRKYPKSGCKELQVFDPRVLTYSVWNGYDYVGENTLGIAIKIYDVKPDQTEYAYELPDDVKSKMINDFLEIVKSVFSRYDYNNDHYWYVSEYKDMFYDVAIPRYVYDKIDYSVYQNHLNVIYNKFNKMYNKYSNFYFLNDRPESKGDCYICLNTSYTPISNDKPYVFGSSDDVYTDITKTGKF